MQNDSLINNHVIEGEKSIQKEGSEDEYLLVKKPRGLSHLSCVGADYLRLVIVPI